MTKGLETPTRPSKKEVDKRLNEARAALKNRRVLFANEPKTIGELMALNISDTDELWELVIKLLNELEVDDYCGGRPPQRSYERTIADCELWAFSWFSQLFNEEMYLKFAIKNGYYYYVSLHKSKFS